MPGLIAVDRGVKQHRYDMPVSVAHLQGVVPRAALAEGHLVADLGQVWLGEVAAEPGP